MCNRFVNSTVKEVTGNWILLILLIVAYVSQIWINIGSSMLPKSTVYNNTRLIKIIFYFR